MVLLIRTLLLHEDVLLQQKSVLSDSLLMELARSVAGRDIESLALEKLGIEYARLRNLKDSRREDIEMSTFDVLCPWRNKSVENTKQVMKSCQILKNKFTNSLQLRKA